MQLNALLYSIGQWSGLAALLSLGLLIFSGDTARFTDRFFGLDRIIKFQRKFSFLAASFLALHPLFFILSGQSFGNYFIPYFAALPLAFGTLAFYIFIAVILCSHYYKRISYEAWQYIHVLTYVLVGLALYHAFFWGSDSSDGLFLGTYIFLIIAIVAGAIYRTWYKLRERRRGVAEVISNRWENDSIFTLSLKTSYKMNFKAGQFCFLRLGRDKLYARHPFSISSAPSDNELLFSIKNTGRFTKVASTLKPGDKIYIDGPFGRFTEREDLKDAVYIAGGVGITPFHSLMRGRGEGKRALLYMARTEKDLIFKDDFENMKQDGVNVQYVLSAEEKEGCRHGYIDKGIIEEASKNMSDPYYYICGPEGLKRRAKEILKEMGVARKRIVIEDFFW